MLTCLVSESADSLREWLSVARVEAEQGSPGSGHAHSGVEKFSRRYTALHTCHGKYFYVEQQIFLLLSTYLLGGALWQLEEVLVVREHVVQGRVLLGHRLLARLPRRPGLVRHRLRGEQYLYPSYCSSSPHFQHHCVTQDVFTINGNRNYPIENNFYSLQL